MSETTEDLQARYDHLLAVVLRMGNWLTSPEAQILPREEWNAQMEGYRENLDKLRRLGDELRPTSLRKRREPLIGDQAVREIADLFAA